MRGQRRTVYVHPAQAYDFTFVYGYVLLLFTAVFFVAMMYGLVVRKLLPDSNIFVSHLCRS